MADDNEMPTGWRANQLVDKDGFLTILILSILSIAAISFFDNLKMGPTISIVFVGMIVLLALHKSQVRKAVRNLAAVVVVVCAVVVCVSAFVDSEPENDVASTAVSFCFIILIGVTLPAIIRRTASHERITGDTVAAALSTYLLLGLLFSYVFAFIASVQTGPFFVQTEAASPFDFVYFSFVTLSTVGYGDFSPATHSGQAAAATEAIVGQVFLVTIVALVVTNIGRERKVRN